MKNKHVLQILSGVLLVLSLFPSWVVSGIYPLKFGEIAVYHDISTLTKPAYFLLPLIGLGQIYFGFTKRKNLLFTTAGIVCGTFLLYHVFLVLNEVIMISTGFYLVFLSVLLSAVSFFIRSKTIESKSHTA